MGRHRPLESEIVAKLDTWTAAERLQFLMWLYRIHRLSWVDVERWHEHVSNVRT